MATDALKSREPQAKSQLDLSIDSLDLSCEEGTPLSVTRSGGTLPPCLLSAHCDQAASCGEKAAEVPFLGTGAMREEDGNPLPSGSLFLEEEYVLEVLS